MLRTISFRLSASPMAASRSTLRANRLGGGLPSEAGGRTSLTSSLNWRSRKARLRGAACRDDTSRLAVASDVPFQASAGMPPVFSVRKPLGRLSKSMVGAGTCAWAEDHPNVREATRTASALQLARKTFIGHLDLEVLEWGARFDDRKGHQPGKHQGQDGDDYHRPETQGGHAKSVSGAEQGHDAGNLLGCRPGGNCRERRRTTSGPVA